MRRSKTYVGIDQDGICGMTPTGNIIRDAWVFGILPETETCAGWTMDRLQPIYDAVAEKWQSYDYQAARLPADLRERHQRIHGEALRKAKEQGWTPPMESE